jgi:prevent-host-death family protein
MDTSHQGERAKHADQDGAANHAVLISPGNLVARTGALAGLLKLTAGEYCGISGKSVLFAETELLMPTTVTSADVSKNFGAYQDAAVREPVIITKNGRPRTVLMAYEDYMRLSRRDRRVERTVELGEADIAAVEQSQMSPGFEALDAELDAPAPRK